MFWPMQKLSIIKAKLQVFASSDHWERNFRGSKAKPKALPSVIIQKPSTKHIRCVSQSTLNQTKADWPYPAFATIIPSFSLSSSDRIITSYAGRWSRKYIISGTQKTLQLFTNQGILKIDFSLTTRRHSSIDRSSYSINWSKLVILYGKKPPHFWHGSRYSWTQARNNAIRVVGTQ